MTTKTKAFETKDALDLYKKIIYTEGKAGRRMDKKQIEEMIDLAIRQLDYSAAYTPTNCAERTAFFKAVSEGVKEFQAICVVGGRDGVLTGYAAPCGVCRQVMMEFCDPETFQIILAVSKDKYDVFTLRELFPLGFGPADLA